MVNGKRTNIRLKQKVLVSDRDAHKLITAQVVMARYFGNDENNRSITDISIHYCRCFH